MRIDLAEFLGLCALQQGVCHHTADHLDAVSALLEKRPPGFVGR